VSRENNQNPHNQSNQNLNDIFSKHNIKLYKSQEILNNQSNAYIALDYGEKRIGIAGGNFVNSFSIGICHYSTRLERFNNLQKIIKEWSPNLIIIGLPLHADGKVHTLTRASCNFGLDLYRYFNIPILWVDERYTTNLFNKKYKEYVDDKSAMLIMQQFLDSNGDALYYYLSN
jgi:putative Holliday junction resolvase